ncbi:unnamed protein product [Ambrosiozyma monospora]|uniref:Unnamed protein product n=1 Tax=Ambrosiozyma monospora TaxID=43982 RepID=A0ACB5T419_AMBMO|nr:unnamed protein product [Ambrosiozyma monospora]
MSLQQHQHRLGIHQRANYSLRTLKIDYLQQHSNYGRDRYRERVPVNPLQIPPRPATVTARPPPPTARIIFGDLPQLNRLVIKNFKLNQSTLDSIPNTVSKLHISQCEFDTGVASLKLPSQLQDLRVFLPKCNSGNTNYHVPTISNLQCLTKLRFLDVTGISFSESVGLVQSLPSSLWTLHLLVRPNNAPGRISPELYDLGHLPRLLKINIRPSAC